MKYLFHCWFIFFFFIKFVSLISLLNVYNLLLCITYNISLIGANLLIISLVNNDCNIFFVVLMFYDEQKRSSTREDKGRIQVIGNGTWYQSRNKIALNNGYISVRGFPQRAHNFLGTDSSSKDNFIKPNRKLLVWQPANLLRPFVCISKRFLLSVPEDPLCGKKSPFYYLIIRQILSRINNQINKM